MKDRIVYIDWLRIVAAVMVVMIHTSGMLLQHAAPHSFTYWIGLCNWEIVRPAVPLFFMITGALMLRKEYDASPMKMVRKAIKVLLLMLVWSFIYAWLSVDTITVKTIVFATIKGHFHFWFFEYLIGIYLLIPILKALVEYKDGVLLKYYLVLFLLFGILISSLQAIPYCHKWIMDVTMKVRFEWLGFAGYVLLGYYLSMCNKQISVWKLIILCCATMCLQGVLTYNNVELLYSSDKFWIATFIESVSIFLIIREGAFVRIGGGVLKQLASLMMGVYIMHPIVLEYMPITMWTGRMYVLSVVLVLGGAFGMSWIIWKVPKIGKWLLSV